MMIVKGLVRFLDLILVKFLKDNFNLFCILL